MTRIRYAVAAGAVLVALVVGAAPATAATKLVGTVGPSFSITLKKGGKKVTTLKAGTYTLTVQDRSDFHNFHLMGPGVNKKTTVAQVKTVTWTIKLKKGTYRFVCDPHSSQMKGSFKVT